VKPERLRQRAAITAAVRQWFDTHGYLEVHTPILVDAPALEEHLEAVSVDGRFLHTSPEFAMKRVLAAGLCRIYQIVPSFREEEQGNHHSREFTMLEWYRANAGTAELMDDVESLIGAAATAVKHPTPSFSRRTVNELRQEAGLADTDDEVEWFLGWVDSVEPMLTTPTIVTGYPAWQAALARERAGLADRFEVYLAGIEIGNCFAEEGQAETLRARFSASATKRQKMGRMPHPVDEGLLEATPAMPRSAGMAIGLDRLVMALTGVTDIEDVQVR
jgi:elongation factor P--(R)-beta-lysine ligase